MTDQLEDMTSSPENWKEAMSKAKERMQEFLKQEENKNNNIKSQMNKNVDNSPMNKPKM